MTEVSSSTLTLHFGATLAVNGGDGFSDWIKPAASYSVTWTGIPAEEQLRIATEFAQTQVLSPLLEEIIVTAQRRLLEARRTR